MFAFGDPLETARMFLNDVVSTNQGPPFVNAAYDEMTENELRDALAWINAAIRQAQGSRLDGNVVETLVEWYDEAFKALLEASDSFLERSKQGHIHSPTGVQDRKKYFAFVKMHLES